MARTRHNRITTAGALASALLACLLAAPAHAQSTQPIEASGAVSERTEPLFTPSSQGLRLNLMGDDSALAAPRLDMPVDAIGSTLFKLDVSDAACLTGQGTCGRRSRETLDLGLSRAITARQDDNGLDLVLRPRASLKFDDQGSSSAIVGAVVEIGEDLRRGSEFSPNTWYLFAGADAEALTYKPESLSRFNRGQFHLQDRIIVGDAQAGVGYRIGDADLSVSYLRREAQAEGLSYTEDAAALSFTWKR